jgi:bacterial/archaeal transporter family protein
MGCVQNQAIARVIEVELIQKNHYRMIQSTSTITHPNLSMKEWLSPALGALIFWGLWSFIPKITTRYLEPRSAIIYEVGGAILLAIVFLFLLNFQVDVHPKGIALALTTGMLGFLGAFCFLVAVSKGPVTLVASLSSLYPALSVLLAVTLLHEALTLRQGFGIALAIVSIILVAA